MMSDTFIIPETFSIKDYFTENIIKFRSERNEQEQYPVTVRLPENKAYLLKNQQIYSSKVNGDFIEASINMYSFECAMKDFWNLICVEAEVISPEEVRDAVKRRLAQLLRVYGQV